MMIATSLEVAGAVVGGMLVAASLRPARRYLDILLEIPERNDSSHPRIDGFYHLRKIESLEDLDQLATTVGGVRLADYGPPLGRQYNPVTTLQLVLSLVPFRRQASARTMMRRNLDHVLDHSEITPEGNRVFPYSFDWPSGGEVAPWYSGMAQGQAASALLWGFRVCADRRYARAAKQAVLAIDEGWPVRFLAPVPGGVWLKEYPTSPYHVVNGSLAGMAGIYDLWRWLDASDPARPVVGSLLDRTIHGFKVTFRRFESKTWGHFYSDRCNVGPPGKYAVTLAWLEYLAEYDPELLDVRARASAPACGGAEALLRVYVWGARCVVRETARKLASARRRSRAATSADGVTRSSSPPRLSRLSGVRFGSASDERGRR